MNKKLKLIILLCIILSIAFALAANGCYIKSLPIKTGDETAEQNFSDNDYEITAGPEESNAQQQNEAQTSVSQSLEISAGTDFDKADESSTEPVSGTEAHDELKYTFITKEINLLESEGKREIIAEYPYFIYEGDEEVFYTANNVIKNEYIDFWINDFRDITDEVFEYMPEDKPGPLGLDINYRIEYMDYRCISVYLHNFSYTGGAHPYAFSSSYNYDIEKRKDIMLNDLFEYGYDYLAFLSSYCYKDIKEQYVELGIDPVDVNSFILDGTDPSEPENFDDFNLTDTALIINFDPYEVGPYVAGAFTVVIPYEEFEGKILYP